MYSTRSGRRCFSSSAHCSLSWFRLVYAWQLAIFCGAVFAEIFFRCLAKIDVGAVRFIKILVVATCPVLLINLPRLAVQSDVFLQLVYLLLLLFNLADFALNRHDFATGGRAFLFQFLIRVDAGILDACEADTRRGLQPASEQKGTRHTTAASGAG